MLDERAVVSHTLGKMLNESVVLHFKALSQHLQSTGTIPGGKGRPARKADNLTAICEP
jgi:hypothetical protein